MSKKTTLALFILFTILIFLSAQIVSAQPEEKRGLIDKAKEYYSKTKIKTKELFDITKTETIDILGFNIKAGRIPIDILTGLLAGFWIWLVYTIFKYYRLVTLQDDTFKEERYYKDKKSRWLNMVAGRIWKVIFIGIGFAVIMQIPILNRVIQIITLEVPFGLGFITRSFIIAIELGIIPTLIEDFRKSMIELKTEKKFNEAIMGAAVQRARGHAMRR